ncbi:hypothetical protein [Geminocystis sp. NIES-3709]|uniref:hypothetical protein n=1 Tax=Geminocystis sp. NIES-3709 TaxID=1617448 RepID=UPI0005FCD327|nr:hypothetical protein [Geminocystis sp. NIES-3709]BAQ66515.1 hypothetical protein GM3709_3280 [Geminocystis sp. NIES-3709]
MSDSKDYNNRKKLEELEAEILNSVPNSIKPKTLSGAITSVKNWFLTLPPTGKIFVGVFGLIIAFSLLRTVLSIVQLAFSLTILGVIFYIVFQFVLKQKD